MVNQLEQNINHLKADTNLYFKLSLFLLIPALLVSVILGNEIATFQNITKISSKYWIFFISAILVLIPVFYAFLRWYINYFYGKYIKELEENYDELIQMEDEAKGSI